MAREIDRKLRLTAALLGAVTRKDLAAAFRRVNAATPFDVERANKWLQGRAQPREQQVYEDWARLLDVGRGGQWVADCDSETFLAEICARHQRDPEALRGRGEAASPLAGRPERSLPLAGTYACYSHAWSPYFRSRLIRGALSITDMPASDGPTATYAEALPTGHLELTGAVTISPRAVNIDVRESPDGSQFLFCLFPPTPPVSVLAGFMCGTTVIGPDVQPSVTRIAMVRLPAAHPRLREADCYLEPQASIAEDLAALGLPVMQPAVVDRHIGAFLTDGHGGGLDQIAASAHRALVALLDLVWLAELRPGQPPAAAALPPDVAALRDRRGGAGRVVRLRRK